MRRTLLFALAALILMIGAPMYGQDMQLLIDDNAGNVVAFDVDEVTETVTINIISGCDDPGECVFDVVDYNAITDTLTVEGNIGLITLNSITAQGGIDNATQVHQNLTQTEATAAGAGQLNVLFTDTAYDNLGNPISMSGNINLNAQSSGSSVKFDIAAGNTIPAAPILGGLPLLSCMTTTVCNAGAVADITNTFGISGNLTSYKEIIFNGPGTVQTTLTVVSQIPEPTAIALLGSLLLGTGLTLRRKFGK